MEAILLIFGIFFAYVIYSWFTSNIPAKKRVIPSYYVPQSSNNIISSTPECFCWPDIGDYDFEVVGESNYQESINKIAVSHEYNPNSSICRPKLQLKAFLIPENDNPYDNKAVRVDIDDLTIGYLGREDARSFRRRLAAKKLSGQITCCSAKLTGGHTKNGKVHSFGVVLDIQPFGQY